jgi:hypothetical protein
MYNTGQNLIDLHFSTGEKIMLMKPEDLLGTQPAWPNIAIPLKCVCGRCEPSNGVDCVKENEDSDLTEGMLLEAEYLHSVQAEVVAPSN